LPISFASLKPLYNFVDALLFATEKPSYKIIRNFLSHVDVSGGKATTIVKIDSSFIMPKDMEPDLGAFHAFGF
jgi:hypothetical protein